MSTALQALLHLEGFAFDLAVRLDVELMYVPEGLDTLCCWPALVLETRLLYKAF